MHGQALIMFPPLYRSDSTIQKGRDLFPGIQKLVRGIVIGSNRHCDETNVCVMMRFFHTETQLCAFLMTLLFTIFDRDPEFSVATVKRTSR